MLKHPRYADAIAAACSARRRLLAAAIAATGLESSSEFGVSSGAVAILRDARTSAGCSHLGDGRDHRWPNDYVPHPRLSHDLVVS
jgi:hypothetical protein